MEQVKDAVKSVPILQGISHKKILDKVRSYFGKDDLENEELPSLPTESESLEDRIKRVGLHQVYNGKFNILIEAFIIIFNI